MEWAQVALGTATFRRFKNTRKEKIQKSIVFKKKITLDKPETRVRFCSKNTKACSTQVLIQTSIYMPGLDKSGCLWQLFWSQPNEPRHVERVLRKTESCYVNSPFGGTTDWRSKASACQDYKTSVHEQRAEEITGAPGARLMMTKLHGQVMNPTQSAKSASCKKFQCPVNSSN